MNILIAYKKTHPYTGGEFLELALRKKHKVYFFDFSKSPYFTNVYNILPFYISKGVPISVSSIVKKYKKDFDLIIEVDGMGQYHLVGYKNLQIPSVLWGIDHDKNKIKFLKYISKDFNKVFYCHKNYIYKLNISTCKWLPMACAPEIHKNFKMKKIYDIVFIGNTNPRYSPERAKLLKIIGEKFDLKIFSGIYGEEVAKIYSQFKIVFNHSINNDLNMRIFEVLSCGTLLITNKLTPDTGLEELFCDKKHLVLYNDANDLIEKINYYLTYETEREEIAYNGYLEVISKHTYDHRAEQIIKSVYR